MNYEDLMKVLDFKKINILLTEATNHLGLLNLRDRVENADETRMLLNSALEDVVFMFRKDGEEELRIGEMKGRIRQVREALQRNIDEKDPQFLLLIDELRRILNKGNVNENNVTDVDADILELESLLERAKALNHQNALLAAKYDGDIKFARIHKALRFTTKELDDVRIFLLLNNVRSALNEVVKSNNNILGNQSYFEATIERTLAILIADNLEYDEYIDFDNLKLSLANEYFKEYEGAVA
jgi:type I restriction enzyme R subunit